MHLHGEQLERYERRELPRSELAAIDAHVSGCLYCSRSLAQAAAASERWERRGWLGRLVRIEEPRTVASPAAESPAAEEAAAAKAA
jgi:hypothetical protein